MFSVFGIFIIASLCVKNSQAATFVAVDPAVDKTTSGACRFNLGLRNRDADTADAKPANPQTAASLEACEDLCTKDTTGCKAIGYDVTKKECTLHNSVPTHVAVIKDVDVHCAVNPASKRPSIPTTSYELANPTVPNGCCRFDQGKTAADASSSGAPSDSSVVVDSIAKCEDACNKKDACFAFEFEASKTKCKLFGAIPTHVGGESECVCAINPSRSPVVPFSAFVAESAAWDSKRSRWISGNIFANVFTIKPTGTGTKPSVKQLPDTVKGTVGVYISNDVVYAVGLDNAIMMGGKVKTVQLIKWNMATPTATPTVVDLSSLVSGVDVAWLNDVVVTSNGDAYLTDSQNGLIYKVDKDNKVSAFISTKPDSWKGGKSGALKIITNGIEAFTGKDDKQYLLVGLSFQGTTSLQRVDIATKAVTQVDVKGEEWKSFLGIDGLRFQPVVINVKAPWEVTTEVPNGGCSCDCCTTTAYVSWHQTETRIRSSWFHRTKCSTMAAGSRKAAYVANVSPDSAPGNEVDFQIAYDGDYDNVENKDLKIKCTLTDGSVKCALPSDGNCEDAFTGHTPRNFLGAVSGNGVYVLNSQDDYKTATVLGVDRRPALGGKSRGPAQTTLSLRDDHLYALSTSFAGPGIVYERKVQLASKDWAAANKAIPSGCCRFNGLDKNDKWKGDATDKAVFAASISACQEACAKSAGCFAIEYVLDKFKCELHGAPSHVEYIPTARCVCAINPNPVPAPAPDSSSTQPPVSGSPSINFFFMCYIAVAHVALLLV